MIGGGRKKQHQTDLWDFGKDDDDGLRRFNFKKHWKSDGDLRRGGQELSDEARKETAF